MDTAPLAAVDGKAMMDTPPLEADAPRTKSTWPPAPEICFRPTDSEATWPIRSICTQELMEIRLSFRAMT